MSPAYVPEQSLNDPDRFGSHREADVSQIDADGKKSQAFASQAADKFRLLIR